MQDDYCDVCGIRYPLANPCSDCWGWSIMIAIEHDNVEPFLEESA